MEKYHFNFFTFNNNYYFSCQQKIIEIKEKSEEELLIQRKEYYINFKFLDLIQMYLSIFKIYLKFTLKIFSISKYFIFILQRYFFNYCKPKKEYNF